MKYKLALIFLFFSMQLFGQDRKEHLVQILSSHFRIDGETNVNKFQCELYQEISPDQLQVKSLWQDYSLSFTGLKLKYPVEQFDCGIEAMNKDMMDLLNSTNYPHLFLEIHTIHIPKSNNEIERLKVVANVSITISGVTRQYQIGNGKVINRTDEELSFSGSRVVKLTDFNIEPPTKFFGMVQVTDEMKVDFEISMKAKTL